VLYLFVSVNSKMEICLAYVHRQSMQGKVLTFEEKYPQKNYSELPDGSVYLVGLTFRRQD
jgi:hypothetical protein